MTYVATSPEGVRIASGPVMVDSAHDAYIQYPTARSVPFVVLNITFGAMTRTSWLESASPAIR